LTQNLKVAVKYPCLTTSLKALCTELNVRLPKLKCQFFFFFFWFQAKI